MVHLTSCSSRRGKAGGPAFIDKWVAHSESARGAASSGSKARAHARPISREYDDIRALAHWCCATAY
jgi:hypothetical protein